MEDSFSTDGEGWGDGSGGNASDGERQMKLRSLTRRSPPAVWPGSQQAADGYQSAARGWGTPWYNPLYCTKATPTNLFFKISFSLPWSLCEVERPEDLEAVLFRERIEEARPSETERAFCLFGMVCGAPPWIFLRSWPQLHSRFDFLS